MIAVKIVMETFARINVRGNCAELNVKALSVLLIVLERVAGKNVRDKNAHNGATVLNVAKNALEMCALYIVLVLIAAKIALETIALLIVKAKIVELILFTLIRGQFMVKTQRRMAQ